MFHGVIPDNCLASVIIPIVKYKNKDLQDVNNYRLIAVASIISKLIERFILHQINPFLQTAYIQFGFKEKHSSDISVFLLKQTINSYVESNTCVFSVSLDATKAFDWVNHYKLLKKLIACHVPTCFVRLLQYWYAHQQRWSHRGRPWPRGRPRGHILKSLASKPQVLGVGLGLKSSKIGLSSARGQHYFLNS